MGDRKSTHPGKIFVGGLSHDTDEAKLKEFFSPHGELADVVVLRDRDTNNSRGFGFVTFSDPDTAERVAADKYVHINGKQAELKLAVPREAMPPGGDRARKGAGRSAGPMMPPYPGAFGMYGGGGGYPGGYGGMPPFPDPRGVGGGVDRRYGSGPAEAYDPSYKCKKAFVGGVGHHVFEDDFKNHFSQFGEVTEAVIMRTADGKPRGFGFVTFASELSCDKACRSASHELGGRTVEVKKAVPKEAIPPTDRPMPMPMPISRPPFGMGGPSPMPHPGYGGMDEYDYMRSMGGMGYPSEMFRAGAGRYDAYGGAGPMMDEYAMMQHASMGAGGMGMPVGGGMDAYARAAAGMAMGGGMGHGVGGAEMFAAQQREAELLAVEQLRKQFDTRGAGPSRAPRGVGGRGGYAPY